MDISQYRNIKKQMDAASVSINIGNSANYDNAKKVIEWIVKGKALDAVMYSIGSFIIPMVAIIIIVSLNVPLWVTVTMYALFLVMFTMKMMLVRRLIGNLFNIGVINYLHLVKAEGHYNNAKFLVKELDDDVLMDSLDERHQEAQEHIKDLCNANKVSEDDMYIIENFIDYCTSVVSYCTASIQVANMQNHPEYDRLMALIDEGDDSWACHEMRVAQFPGDNPEIIKDIHASRDISKDILSLYDKDVKVGDDE